jgi:hypothetical protein
MAASTKLARYCAKSSTVDGLLYDGTKRVDGFEADRRRRRSLSVVQRRGREGTGATFAPRRGESGSSDWQSATQRVGLILGWANCNRCQFAATWNEINVPALPVLPRSTTRKPSPEVGWFSYEHDGYANLPGLLARRVG